MYVGLWSRVSGFERDALTRALEDRAVVQATMMRGTIHLLAPDDYWPITAAVREVRRELWRGTRPGVTDAEMERAAARVRAHLEAEGPTRRKDLEALVGKVAAAGVGLWLDLVRVPPSGTWERRRADLYGLAEDWLGPPPADPTSARGIALLVERYLTAFGPARPAEIASWAGLKAAALAPILDVLDLRRFAGGLVDLPGLPLPDPGTPAPVRLLPAWDASLLVHCRRAQILPEEHRDQVFGVRMPQSHPTFLVDGQVAGRWKVEADGRPACTPFRRLTTAERRAVDDELDRVAAFHAG